MKIIFGLILGLIAIGIFPFNLRALATAPGLMFVGMSLALLIIAYRLMRKKPAAAASLPLITPSETIKQRSKAVTNKPLTSTTPETEEEQWATALAEFDGPSRRSGLWAQSLSAEDGNEERAKAVYLRRRVNELQSAPPAVVTTLRNAGYRIEVNESRWVVTEISSGITRYFNSIEALEAKTSLLLKQRASDA
jgi:hypothetical protein